MKESCAFMLHLCGVDRRAWVLDEMTPDDRRRIADRAARMVRAIQDNDFAAWGL